MINRDQRPGRLKPERSDSNNYSRSGSHNEFHPLRHIAMPFSPQNVLSFRFENNTNPVNFVPSFDPSNVSFVNTEPEDNSKDMESRKEHFLWEEIDSQFVPILIRNEDDRYLSRTLLEIILFRSESWDRLSQFSRQLDSLIGFPLTKYELELLHKICDFHMNGLINGVSYSILRSTINNDLLIFYDDFLDFYDAVKKLKNSVSFAPISRNNKRGSLARFQIPVVLGSLVQNASCVQSSRHDNVILSNNSGERTTSDVVGFRELQGTTSAQTTTTTTAELRSFVPLTVATPSATVSPFIRAADDFGWVQINNVFLPFVTKRSNRFFAKYVPIEILMTCNVITENDSLVKNFMLKVTGDDLKLLNKLISDVKIFNEQLPESTYLINLYHLMMCVSNVYVKFLAMDNPRKCVTRRYKEILNFSGGGMQIQNKIIPYLLSDNQYFLPISMCVDDVSLLMSLRSHSRPSRPIEIEYLNLLLVYFSIDRVLLPDECLIDLVTLYSIAKFSCIPRYISLDDFQKQERAKLLSIVVKYNSEKRQNTLPLGEMILAGIELISPTPVSFTSLPLSQSWHHAAVVNAPCRNNSVCKLNAAHKTTVPRDMISAKSDCSRVRTAAVGVTPSPTANVNTSNVLLSHHNSNSLLGMNQYPVIFNPLDVSQSTGQVTADQSIPGASRQVIFNPPILLVPNSHSGHVSCSPQNQSLLSNTISFVINAQNNVIVNHPNSNVDWQSSSCSKVQPIAPAAFKHSSYPTTYYSSSWFSNPHQQQQSSLSSRAFHNNDEKLEKKKTVNESSADQSVVHNKQKIIKSSVFEYRGKKLTCLHDNNNNECRYYVSLSEFKNLFFPKAATLDNLIQFISKDDRFSIFECDKNELLQILSKESTETVGTQFIETKMLDALIDSFEKHCCQSSTQIISGSKKRKAQKPTPCFRDLVQETASEEDMRDYSACKLRSRTINQETTTLEKPKIPPCRLLRSNAAAKSNECNNNILNFDNHQHLIENSNLEEESHRPVLRSQTTTTTTTTHLILDVQILSAVKVHKALYALFKKPGCRKKQIVSLKDMNFHQPKCFRMSSSSSSSSSNGSTNSSSCIISHVNDESQNVTTTTTTSKTDCSHVMSSSCQQQQQPDNYRYVLNESIKDNVLRAKLTRVQRCPLIKTDDEHDNDDDDGGGGGGEVVTVPEKHEMEGEEEARATVVLMHGGNEKMTENERTVFEKTKKTSTINDSNEKKFTSSSSSATSKNQKHSSYKISSFILDNNNKKTESTNDYCDRGNIFYNLFKQSKSD